MYVKLIPRRSYRKLCYLAALFCFALIFYRVITNFFVEQRVLYLTDFQRKLAFIKPKGTYQREQDMWAFMGNPSLRHKIYSAIFDNRNEINGPFSTTRIQYGSVKVFGVLPLIMDGDMKCFFKRENNIIWEERATEALPIHEHFDMYFSAYIINCPLYAEVDQNIVNLPKTVALAYDLNPETYFIPNFVEIRYPKHEDILKTPYRNLSVCIGPLQSNYSNVLRLVEFIEVHRMLGAEKFYFYKLSVSSEIEKTLNYYKSLDIIEVLQWNFYGYKFEEEVRYSGIFVTLNECVYRSTFIDGFKYTAIIDTDEILFPLKHNSLTEYIAEIDNNKTSSFIFRGVFFHKNHVNDTSITPKYAKNKFLYTQIKIQRTKDPFPTHSRSKYIVRGEMAIELGNHHIWRAIQGTYENTLPVSDALLFHYRTKCVTYSCNATLTVDFQARRLGALIWTNVDHVCGAIFENGICPLSLL